MTARQPQRLSSAVVEPNAGLGCRRRQRFGFDIVRIVSTFHGGTTIIQLHDRSYEHQPD
jgi:hypothetical protein